MVLTFLKVKLVVLEKRLEKSFHRMPELRFVSANTLYKRKEMFDIARTVPIVPSQESLKGCIDKLAIYFASSNGEGA